MTDRALATIRRIDEIKPIEGADKIEAIRVGGWWVVAQKGQGHEVGSTVVYFEIDSFLPASDERFADFCERSTRVNENGDRGHVLKTIRLRGTYSQGAIMPLTAFPELGHPDSGYDQTVWTFNNGDDVTEALGITKWEPPVPAELSGNASGLFPSFMRRTDAERVQNLSEMFPLDDSWIPTEKVDGTSATYALSPDGEFVVCSRNYVLMPSGNLYWKIAERYGIEEYLRTIKASTVEGAAVVLQGEIFGEGIQKNPLGIKGNDFVAFNLQWGVNIAEQINRLYLKEAVELPKGMQRAKIYEGLTPPQSVDEALEQVEGIKSLISPERQTEGVVWWRTVPSCLEAAQIRLPRNFKAINNKFLAKQKD